jgi:hypothetical protein
MEELPEPEDPSFFQRFFAGMKRYFNDVRDNREDFKSLGLYIPTPENQLRDFHHEA